MASRMGPRTVKDATRFTSTIPHATSKAAGPSAGAANASATTPKPSRIPGETPEQRVRRLRLAHLAAQRAQISRTDRFIDASRRFLDVAHRWTVGGIVLFTAVAGVVSIYSVWDMLRYNRARRAEWAEAQKKLEADSLATARLAYLKGEATPEQTVLVEEANRKAEESGVKLPPLISPPEHRTHFEEHFKPALQGDSKATDNGEGKGVFGALTGLFASGEQKAERAANAAANKTEEEAQAIGTSVRGAWEHEKENQRRGGTLDQLGLETAGASQAAPKKKGWWPW